MFMYKMVQFNLNSYAKCETVFDTYREALECLVMQQNIDMSIFRDKYHLVPNNIAWMNKDENERYYVDVDLRKNADIYTNFELEVENRENVKINLVLNDKKLDIDIDDETILLLVCSMYTRIKLRFTFETKPMELKLGFNAHLCKPEIRKQLIQDEFCVSEVKYYNGIAVPNKLELCLR